MWDRLLVAKSRTLVVLMWEGLRHSVCVYVCMHACKRKCINFCADVRGSSPFCMYACMYVYVCKHKCITSCADVRGPRSCMHTHLRAQETHIQTNLCTDIRGNIQMYAHHSLPPSHTASVCTWKGAHAHTFVQMHAYETRAPRHTQKYSHETHADMHMHARTHARTCMHRRTCVDRACACILYHVSTNFFMPMSAHSYYGIDTRQSFAKTYAKRQWYFVVYASRVDTRIHRHTYMHTHAHTHTHTHTHTIDRQ